MKFPGTHWILKILLVITCTYGSTIAFSQPNNVINFWQEYHEAYPVKNISESTSDVRQVMVDDKARVWIATDAGVFILDTLDKRWIPISGTESVPAYALQTMENSMLIGTWQGLYRYEDHRLKKYSITTPITHIQVVDDMIFAMGLGKVFEVKNDEVISHNYEIASSIRGTCAGPNGHLLLATDVGVFDCHDDQTGHYYDTDFCISAYTSDLIFNGDLMYVGGLGGVSVVDRGKMIKKYTPENGLQSAEINCLEKGPDGTIWIGTNLGVARIYDNDSISHRFSKRWLADDKVNDITFDHHGNAWIATAGGVSMIGKKKMSLQEKAAYYYHILMTRHIRAPWIAGHCRLEIEGDTSSWIPDDDDNDGEYTGGYLAMESLRFAVTGDPDAREKANKAFDFLKLLYDVTGKPGFFARTVVPATWTNMHDPNRTFTPQERIEALVRDPRSKPVEQRWHLSADGLWRWKGDTSSDEMDGHMMGYFYFYQFAATEDKKKEIAQHVSNILDNLIANDYKLIDVDGTHTRWGVWSPEILLNNPDWLPERNLNCFELLAFLKFGYAITKNEKYQKEYLHLINDKHYLSIIENLHQKNPAWYIYFDVTLEGYLWPILMTYEQDPSIRNQYERFMDEWFQQQKKDESALNNLFYNLSGNKKEETGPLFLFLEDTPLDLIDWPIDHSKREDMKIVRYPALEDRQTEFLVPPSMRATIRWDRDPWSATEGDPYREREPVFWLFPYWLARYLGMI
ncbi:MAG: hypothetical protein KDC53_09535 [Saprospiraceae bacterium]|nr:hypothetical protein [Saprospiraceae bacterium]